MAWKVKFNKKVSIQRVVTKLVVTLFALYIGGQILHAVGTAMNATSSPFNEGLELIGWNVNSGILDYTGSSNTGILSIVGLVGIASIVLEFVKFRL